MNNKKRKHKRLLKRATQIWLKDFWKGDFNVFDMPRLKGQSMLEFEQELLNKNRSLYKDIVERDRKKYFLRINMKEEEN